jgi:hypothetical protein
MIAPNPTLFVKRAGIGVADEGVGSLDERTGPFHNPTLVTIHRDPRLAFVGFIGACGVSKSAVARRHQGLEFVRILHLGNIGLPFLHLLRNDCMARSREVREHLIIAKHFGQRIQIRAIWLRVPDSAQGHNRVAVEGI